MTKPLTKSSFDESTLVTNNPRQSIDILMPEIVKAQMKEYLEAATTAAQDEPLSSHQRGKMSSRSNDKLSDFDYDFLKDNSITKFEVNQPPIKNDNLYYKDKERRLKLEHKLQSIRHKQSQEELSALKTKPTINSKSKLLSKNKPPIYKRLNEIENHKKEKLAHIQSEISKENFIKENRIGRNYSMNKRKGNSGGQITFDQWLEMNEAWDDFRKSKLEYIKHELEEFNNDDEEMIFSPKLNPKSKKMMKENIKHGDYLHRLANTNILKQEFIEKKIQEQTPTFTPVINKDYAIPQKYYEFMEANQEQIYNQCFNRK